MFLQGINPNEWTPLDKIELKSYIEAINEFEKYANYKNKIPLPFILKTAAGYEILFGGSYHDLSVYLIKNNNAIKISKNNEELHNGYQSNKFNIVSIHKYQTNEKEQQNFRQTQHYQYEQNYLAMMQQQQAMREQQQAMREQQQAIRERQEQQKRERIFQHEKHAKELRKKIIQEEKILEQQRLEEQLNEVKSPMKRENTQPSQDGGNYFKYKFIKYNFKLKMVQ
jgi:hypothetical protein